MSNFWDMGLTVWVISCLPIMFAFSVMHYIVGLDWSAIWQISFVPLGSIMASIAQNAGIQTTFNPEIFNSVLTVGNLTLIYVTGAGIAAIQTVRESQMTAKSPQKESTT
jgi:hypothetical protein